ncbi:MAG: methyltransferase, partial [Bacteroidota bacterium]
MTSKARNNRFQFQQFAIDQVEHGMRISEDAVIFGAWIELEPGTTMDVGCGTGLLSLMLAQRYPEALITGVELDKEAALLAERNFKKSPFD